MFRIHNERDLSKRELAMRRASDEQFAARLARSLTALANKRAGYVPPKAKPLPKAAKYVVEPVGKVQKLWKARRAGTSKACRFAVVNPDTMLHFGK